MHNRGRKYKKPVGQVVSKRKSRLSRVSTKQWITGAVIAAILLVIVKQR